MELYYHTFTKIASIICDKKTSHEQESVPRVMVQIPIEPLPLCYYSPIASKQ